MTWAKYGTEFYDQLADYNFSDRLDDACQLTHTQAVHYVYSVEAMNLTFPKKNLRRFATSNHADEAAQALVEHGVWEDLGKRYRIIHHEHVIRQSLGYQLKERDRSRKAMQKKRDKELGTEADGVTQDVTRNDTRNVMRTQTDRQTYSQDSEATNNTEVLDTETGELSSFTSSDETQEPTAGESPGSDMGSSASEVEETNSTIPGHDSGSLDPSWINGGVEPAQTDWDRGESYRPATAEEQRAGEQIRARAAASWDDVEERKAS